MFAVPGWAVIARRRPAVSGSTVRVNDATVTKTDIVTSNGVIHFIDTVLLPPAM